MSAAAGELGCARARVWNLGPLEVWAYHDWPAAPWRSALFCGLAVFELPTLEVGIPPQSILRPFSGEVSP